MSTFWTRKRRGKGSRSKYSASERKAQLRLRLAHAWATRKALFGPSGISPEGLKKRAEARYGERDDFDMVLDIDWGEIV